MRPTGPPPGAEVFSGVTPPATERPTRTENRRTPETSRGGLLCISGASPSPITHWYLVVVSSPSTSTSRAVVRFPRQVERNEAYVVGAASLLAPTTGRARISLICGERQAL